MTVEALLTRWPTGAQKVELLHGVLVFAGDFDGRDWTPHDVPTQAAAARY
ncbi:hypothetical protein [Streptomyces virginiae]|nr:hypothetical protein [Streptomyces virginiae]MCX5278198.1 hypothetical protein [Streptomyces virginiae]